MLGHWCDLVWVRVGTAAGSNLSSSDWRRECACVRGLMALSDIKWLRC